jgi:hypothetical protein
MGHQIPEGMQSVSHGSTEKTCYDTFCMTFMVNANSKYKYINGRTIFISIYLPAFYHGTTLLSTTYKILSNILLLRLTPFNDGISNDMHCGF